MEHDVGAQGTEAGVTLYQGPGCTGPSRRLGDTGLNAYSVAALGLERVGSVRVSAEAAREGSPRRIFRAQLYDRAPVYLPTGEAARSHRLDVTADLADTGEWADRTRYVTVASCRAADADWGFGRPLAAGEPARYTLVERAADPPDPHEQATPLTGRPGPARVAGSWGTPRIGPP